MRYERVTDILKLATMLQGRADGLSIEDIMNEFHVSRRTAERMRDALVYVFPQIEELKDFDRKKRWRLPAQTLGRMIEPHLDELAALNRGIEICKVQGDMNTAQLLDKLQHRIRASFSQKSKNRLEPDIAAILEADGVASRPGPREKIDKHILNTIREAILSGFWINIDHRGRSQKLSRDVWLGPLAMLMGEGTQYLIAWSDYQEDVRLFTLSGIEDIELSEDVFERPKEFDLQAYIDRAFGVFQEEPHDVIWKFNANAAKYAANYKFHPTQEMQMQDDGNLIVKFRAGGLLEMKWHLARWGDDVEVLEPNALKQLLK